MQLDTQKHEVSQYLRSAHANRNAEVRVSRCMNTRHAEGQVDVEVSSGMARENAAGHMDTHVSPRMQPKACRTTHKRSGGSFLLAGNFYIYPATLVYFYSFRHTKDTPKLPKDCPEEKESYFRVLISPDQFIQDIEVGFLGFNITVPRRKFGGDKRGLVNIRNQRVEPHRLITPDQSRCQFVDPRLETMSGLRVAGRGPESGGLGLTWLDHQGRVSHVDVTAPGESDRGPGHGDSD
ncbi:hypothetical protein F2Q68_00040199 [Brassica cretica]|uniref:Uncharacterized protein n=1 Tax=Brassica cretica TaxID=69181 RepID=A0A8S9MCA4_BRACR|nr:hypothetical protein F2Q68_00040199 [Brassica cretica]